MSDPPVPRHVRKARPPQGTPRGQAHQLGGRLGASERHRDGGAKLPGQRQPVRLSNLQPGVGGGRSLFVASLRRPPICRSNVPKQSWII